MTYTITTRGIFGFGVVVALAAAAQTFFGMLILG
jgi:hypothetical protein